MAPALPHLRGLRTKLAGLDDANGDRSQSDLNHCFSLMSFSDIASTELSLASIYCNVAWNLSQRLCVCASIGLQFTHYRDTSLLFRRLFSFDIVDLLLGLIGMYTAM